MERRTWRRPRGRLTSGYGDSEPKNASAGGPCRARERAGAASDRPRRASPTTGARLPAAPRPGDAPPSSRPMLTGSASPKLRRRCGLQARASSSSPISARGSRRGARCRLRLRSTCSTASRAGPSRRIMQSTGLRLRSAAEDELERWSGFAARRGRPSPCAIHLDTGMNRLGFHSLARLQAAMETHGPSSGADLADEPFRLIGDPGAIP